MLTSYDGSSDLPLVDNFELTTAEKDSFSTHTHCDKPFTNAAASGGVVGVFMHSVNWNSCGPIRGDCIWSDFARHTSRRPTICS